MSITMIGNAHIDICWLWPYRETQRKVARTFAAQLRLMDLYRFLKQDLFGIAAL